MKSILELQTKKNKNEKITMITCYDFTFAKLIDQTHVDLILVGDSVSQVIHGYPNTLSATVPMMCLHTKAVARGTQKLIITDMPFLSTRKGLKHTMDCVHQIMKSGAGAIKIEGADGHLELIKHIVDSGVPVMGHLGLTPQSIHQLGGPKIQGRSSSQAEKLMTDALALENAGCFSIVLECVPAELGEKISKKLKIPTIGIGAGPDCNGQVLVLQDMLGMNSEFNPKFLKKYNEFAKETISSVNHYVLEVSENNFPSKEHCYE